MNLEYSHYKNMNQLQLNIDLIGACWQGSLEIVKYLLASPELKDHANIHTDNDKAFIYACMRDSKGIIEYLIFDYKITKTENIQKWLKDNTKSIIYIIKMFEKRELEEKLKDELKYHEKPINPLKI